MKICIAQTKPVKGNISSNIEAHIGFIERALTFGTEAIFFPELSLTGYEPELAKELATTPNDSRLDIFQQIADKNNMIIGLGLPIENGSRIHISMIIFEPEKPRQNYAKQLLHEDEMPYFENGIGQVIIKARDAHIAPAICYESLQEIHSATAFELGANIYLASVAKSAAGVQKAFKHYPEIATQFAMPVLMANCIGFCDNFLSVGMSSVWTKGGVLVGQLDDKTEGILIFDTETEEIVKRNLIND